ncbi:MAG: IS1634 family transposase [Candidatus Undinarchaeales archaeon]|jgi:transposase|nr:IS1634 family transposase [Candidatus Undinarchaeales archaeon]MDP7492835.1 IS1634 family transposase [Candidatus Undinarchaeales archaeon]
MTFIRRIKRGDSTYVYNVRTYREKGTGKVKQDTEYLGKEVEKDGETTIIPPKRRTKGLRSILDYGEPMALYKLAKEFGLPEVIDSCIAPHTRIDDIGLKTTILAINKVTADASLRATGSWFSRTALRERVDLTSADLTPKCVRGILSLLSKETPDVTGLIEEGIARRIKKLYSDDLDTLVYDLTPMTYYGDCNDLARYGHAYRSTGEKQVNMVLAVTMGHRLPIHHKVLPGNIVSVSTIRTFLKELEVFGVKNLVLVLDRGFYSKRNIEEILGAKHDVIGALASNLNLTKRALTKSVGMENSRNRIRYPGAVTFAKEFKEDDIRAFVYHDSERRSRQLTSFYEGLTEVERKLDDLGEVAFPIKDEMLGELHGVCGDYAGYIRVTPTFSEDWSFTYRVKHKAVQRTTNRFGKTVLFTSTSLNAVDVLKLYREKDVIDKTFRLMKDRGLGPLQANLEGSTRARVFLAYLGYLMLCLLRMKLKEETSLEEALSRLGEVREVLYKDGSRELPELTKQQKAVLKMLGMM